MNKVEFSIFGVGDVGSNVAKDHRLVPDVNQSNGRRHVP